MHPLTAFLPVLLPLTLVTAHFQLNSPSARGFDEDTLATFPCGGQDTPSSNRSLFPLAGGPVQLNMEHDHAEVQVLLGLGNDVGENFNITLEPIFLEEGIGQFCMGDVVSLDIRNPFESAQRLKQWQMVPSSLNIKDGTNATIQVVTNGDPSGGLYNVKNPPFPLNYSHF